MTTPTVELVPGDDFSLTVTLTDSDGNAIDYSGWSVHTAEITWSDDTTTTLSVDLTNADTGVFVLTCADTDTDGKRLGLVHELRLKLQSGAGLEKTVYYAEVKGVETLTSDTATGFVPGLSAGQVKELYEANSDTNAFTDAEQTKLSGIETGATADQTGAEIKALYEAEADTNAFTDAEKTKLAGIEASADVTDAANVASAGAVMDGDFATNGLMKRTGSGTYDIVTDNSANWNTAFGWGDHAVEGYLTSVAVGDLTDWPASVSTTEVGYLDGVTSAIQTQLNAKASTSQVREKLTANRTYYVRTDGSDSNDGLSNTSGGAFLTIQKAYDTICTLDLGGYTATISVADGTYTDRLSINKPFVGGNVTLTGSTSAIISPSSGACIELSAATTGSLQINGMKLTSIGSVGRGIYIKASGLVLFSGTEFGECSANHILCNTSGARVEANGNYSITGDASYHWTASYGGVVWVSGRTITLTDTPDFNAFAQASNAGTMLCNADTFTGSATGLRYAATTNGVVNSAGSGATYLPGDSAGQTNSGGQYA